MCVFRYMLVLSESQVYKSVEGEEALLTLLLGGSLVVHIPTVVSLLLYWLDYITYVRCQS